jgi:hypothetical protein
VAKDNINCMLPRIDVDIRSKNKYEYEYKYKYKYKKIIEDN